MRGRLNVTGERDDRMTRTLLVFSMITAILAAVFTAQAQTTARVYRVGWITPWSVAEFTGDSNPRFNTFRQEMRQRGYVEGENLIFELRSVEASPERISEVVGELIRLNVASGVEASSPRRQPQGHLGRIGERQLADHVSVCGQGR
jgi:hypothetical protein